MTDEAGLQAQAVNHRAAEVAWPLWSDSEVQHALKRPPVIRDWEEKATIT